MQRKLSGEIFSNEELCGQQLGMSGKAFPINKKLTESMAKRNVLFKKSP